MAFVCTKEIDIKNADSVRSGSELVGRLIAASYIVCLCLSLLVIVCRCT